MPFAGVMRADLAEEDLAALGGSSKKFSSSPAALPAWFRWQEEKRFILAGLAAGLSDFSIFLRVCFSEWRRQPKERWRGRWEMIETDHVDQMIGAPRYEPQTLRGTVMLMIEEHASAAGLCAGRPPGEDDDDPTAPTASLLPHHKRVAPLIQQGALFKALREEEEKGVAGSKGEGDHHHEEKPELLAPFPSSFPSSSAAARPQNPLTSPRGGGGGAERMGHVTKDQGHHHGHFSQSSSANPSKADRAKQRVWGTVSAPPSLLGPDLVQPRSPRAFGGSPREGADSVDEQGLGALRDGAHLRSMGPASPKDARKRMGRAQAAAQALRTEIEDPEYMKKAVDEIGKSLESEQKKLYIHDQHHGKEFGLQESLPSATASAPMSSPRGGALGSPRFVGPASASHPVSRGAGGGHHRPPGVGSGGLSRW